jgi:RNA polymerase sigma-70 factor (ECF subfamily)
MSFRSAAAFPSSHWSLVARAGAADSLQARQALSELCRRYWYPLYVFVRRQVASDHDAEDITQGFFAHVVEKEVFAAANPARGRFRTYLLSCCKNYLANHRRAAQSAKRGGAAVVVGIDFESAAERYAREPADPSDPEQLYLRRWAFTLLEETFADLRNEFARDERELLFERLRPALIRGPDSPSYAAIAGELNMTEDAVKKSAQRLRERFGDRLRERIADTVDDSASVEDEIRDLFAAVRE